MLTKNRFWLAASINMLILACGLSFAQTPDSDAGSPADKTVQTILNKGYKRIAVLPRVVVQSANNTNKVVGTNTLGALSYAWPDELYESLIDASVASNGKFAVVTEQQILQALKGKKGEDVGTEEMWKVIREKTGADFLASIDVTDPGPSQGRTGSAEVKRVVNSIDLKDNSAVARVRQEYKKSLSDAAYAGESFVVREWKGNKLEATGLTGGLLFDPGPVAEKQQYAMLVPQEHPLLRDNFPYGLGIEVNGQLRTPSVIDGQLVVRLDMGEEYVVRVWNRSEREVFMGLYVDGVNSIGGNLEQPEKTPTERTWFLRPSPDARRISGWQKIDPQTKEASYEKFVIVGASDTVAREASQPGGDAFDDNLGLITAVFYSYGMDEIPRTKGIAKLANDNIGTGRGQKVSGGVAGYDANAKQKGLLLSSVSIFYRSSKWVNDTPGEAAPAMALGPMPKSDSPPAAKKTGDKPTPETPAKTPDTPSKPIKDSENDLPE